MPKPPVVIDPGHGGTFEVGGSSWNNAISFSGVMEKAMTLQIALLVRDALAAIPRAGINVVLTRQTDVNLGLPNRAAIAKSTRALRFLSIHFNGFNKRARGVETLIRSVADGNVNFDEDRAFAARVQRAVFTCLQGFDAATKDRGIKTQKLGVLSDASLGNTPASHPCRACLLEIEFIDVEAVDMLLNTAPSAPAVRAAIAQAIARAIVQDLEAT
jgi:N-acetylmuramoyl-L-alanine amidase